MDIGILRRIISDGWTRDVRQLLMNKVGEKNFAELAEKYLNLLKDTPAISIKGSLQKHSIFSRKQDIKVSPDIDAYLNEIADSGVFNEFVSYGGIGTNCKNAVLNYFKKLFSTNNCRLTNQKRSMKKLDKLSGQIEKVKKANLFDISITTEPIVLSDIIRTKRVGNSASLQKSPNFISKRLKRRAEISKFEKLCDKYHEKSIYITLERKVMRFINKLNKKYPPNIEYYSITRNGEEIGQYSLVIAGDKIYVNDYFVLPQFRNTTSSLNALLTVRDGAREAAQKHNLHKIATGVSTESPQLVGLYNRFGFKLTTKETIIDSLSQESTLYNMEAVI